jgi:uncharacterized protein DUF6899
MPYIDKGRRAAFDSYVDELVDSVGRTGNQPGDLNYIISRLLTETRKRSYSSYNEAVGILECAKIEFYRRVVSEYEDEKIVANADLDGYRHAWRQGQ